MIELRTCASDADLELWLDVRRAVHPEDRTSSLAEMRGFMKPEDLRLLAYVDGELAGSGLCTRSDVAGNAFLAPRVLADKRGNGVGTALLARVAEHAVELGLMRGGSHVAGDDARSVAFAQRFGFAETRREVEQVLVVDRPREPRSVEGVEFVSIAERPELLEAAWPVAQQGYEDMPIDGLDIHLDSWLVEEATLPAGSFVALAGGEVVGFAGLCRWSGDDTKAEHGLTVVRRDWRGRGVAAALKEREIAWAASNGVRELVTWTQTGNENMRAVNETLGYVLRRFDISFHRDLPLP
jgi:GNAT superfamily N-acetyltransferase